MSTVTAVLSGISRTMSTWMKLCLGIIVVAVTWWAFSSFDYERYLTPTALAQRLNDAGPLAPLLLISSMVCAVIIPPVPSLPLDLAAGAAFGPFYGALYAVIGAEIGAIICFLIARALGREALSRFLKTENTFCQTCTDHQLMGVMFLARFIPIFSFDMVSYGAGFTNISLKTFAVATFLGTTPPTVAFTYFGSTFFTAQWPLIAAGGAMVALFLFLPSLLTRYRGSPVARLLLGPPPTSETPPTGRRTIPLKARCTGCGAILS